MANRGSTDVNGDRFQNVPMCKSESPINSERRNFSTSTSLNSSLSPASLERRALLRKGLTKNWDTDVYSHWSGDDSESDSDSDDSDIDPEDGGKMPIRLLERQQDLDNAKRQLFFKVLLWILFLAVSLCAFVGIAICTGKFFEKQGESVEHQQEFDPRDQVQTQHHHPEGNQSYA